MPLKLVLDPVARDSFTAPLLEQVTKDGLSFITSLSSATSEIKWAPLKTDVHLSTYRTYHDNGTWIARVIKVHADYGVIHRAMIDERVLAESEWLDGPKDTNEEMAVEEFEGGILVRDVRRFLHIQAFAGREFLASVISKDLLGADGWRSSVVISLPIEGEMVSESDVRGKYISVEYISELANGEVEILTGVCQSDAGGSIPRWVQNMALPGQIFNDGKRFIEYIRKQPVANETVDEKSG
ncbi:unnamed protein product [Tuber aestivum]|uniref:DUF3074 domain-containing protein n=1 Tax=Tuber aestivum TaxID=59557 RepID=A0A292PPK4_9PEZI|nr:unnamed protein product [Tuber aestivum]